MNVLVRTNGINRELRLQYRDFFRKYLSDWISDAEMIYTSDRGGIGSEFPRYKSLSEFENNDQIITFLQECIDGIFKIYPIIAQNPYNLFDNVLRAAPPWHDTIVQVTKEQSLQPHA